MEPDCARDTGRIGRLVWDQANDVLVNSPIEREPMRIVGNQPSVLVPRQRESRPTFVTRSESNMGASQNEGRKRVRRA